MDNHQKLLTSLLSAAIRNRMPAEVGITASDLEYLWKEARAHDADILIYPLLQKILPYDLYDNEIFKRWKSSSLNDALLLAQSVQQISRLLALFHKEGIAAIVLKGLVTRSFYPYPELRTMSDYDILIHAEDMDAVKKVLTQEGYIEASNNDVHKCFIRKGCKPIEVHWTLIYDKYIGSAEAFEKYVWQNAVPVEVCGASALMLSPEDQIMHQCLHMTVHMIYSGFGLRQLCDLVLTVEKYRYSTDWNSIGQKARECSILRFTEAIFIVCRKLFGMEVPQEIYNSELEGSPYVDLLINEIFASGTHGGKSQVRSMSNMFIRDETKDSITTSSNKLIYYIKLLFPAANTLSDRYSYAKKHPYLLPAAWMHRLIRSIFRKDLSLSEKIIFPEFYGKRSKLLDWLNLQ